MAAHSLFLGCPNIPISNLYLLKHPENEPKITRNSKKDRSLSVASRRTIQVLKEKETSEKKEEKGVKKKNVVDTQYQNILRLLLKKISHQKIPTHSGIAVNLQ